jgi:hypothetical protein
MYHTYMHNPVHIVFSTEDRRKRIRFKSCAAPTALSPFSSCLPTALPWATLQSRLTALRPLPSSTACLKACSTLGAKK